MTLLDLHAGSILGEQPSSIRTLSDIAAIFSDSLRAREQEATTVYEIFGTSGEIDGPPQLLYATTVLHPGTVDGEFFMTRGHFHTKPERGEFMLTLSGEGMLVLMDRDRQSQTEPMQGGSIHQIDGKLAHRVVNTSEAPLVFLVVWMSDCGHDYESIRESGFSLRVFQGPSGLELRPS